ncbi:MAG: hypothetical protein P1V29_03865 [Gammaproteobacteria bacterium]|jgi:hypothetical protein|nr:hypothetical protein [Gammaproteobacteria bacterium]
MNKANQSRALLLLIAIFYAYGGIVHLANMLGMAGYDWMTGPFKWRVLDVVYLMLDATVAIGLVARWKVAYLAFFTAATSQIILYTIGANWIMTVPIEFLPDTGHEMALGSLVTFHVVTLVLMALSMWLHRASNSD